MAVLSLALFAAPALAEPGLVTDNGDGVGTNGTLRHELANAGPGETVTYSPGMYTLLTAQISINQPVTIVGSDMAVSYIYGTSSSRIFNLATTGTVRLQNLTLLEGNAPDTAGGVKGGSGGAITSSQGRLEVDHVRFLNNHAGDSAYAGDGSSGLDGGTGPAGAEGGDGGAIAVTGSGQLLVTNSAFDSNVAGHGGAGGFGGDGSSLNGDGGPGGAGGKGGAIFESSTSPAEVRDSTFTGNHGGFGGTGGATGDTSNGGVTGSGANAGVGGAGGAIAGAVSEISTSTFSANIGGAGLNGGAGVPAGTGGSGGSGGAIWAPAPLITNSTIGPGNAGGLATSGAGGSGFAGNGGGVQLTVAGTIASSTIVGNEAYLGPTIPFSGSGGGVVGTASSTIRNSIIANNKAGNQTGAATSNCLGPTIDGGTNLTTPAGTGCPGTVANPLLGSLASNGGPTQTMALLAGSPAIDKGANCPATDQRGISRPQPAAGVCDIGAFEVEQATAAGASQPLAKKKCKKKKKKRHAVSAKKKRCKKKKKR